MSLTSACGSNALALRAGTADNTTRMFSLFLDSRQIPIRHLTVILLLVTCGCVHRVPPRFSERKCAKGTQEIVTAYRYAENGRMVCCRSVTMCGIIDPALTKKFGLPVVRTDLSPVVKGEDPFDADGDEGAAADKSRKHWWSFLHKEKDRDRD